MEDLKNLVTKTRTVHAFKPGVEIATNDLEEVVNMSLLAPNHRLTFPWHILHVSEESRAQLQPMAREIAQKKGMDEEGQQKAADKVMAPSALLVYVLPLKPDNKREEREDYATLSCSIQLLALGLQSKGFYYKWSTGSLSRHEQTYKVLGVNPETHEIIGFIWVGHALKEPVLRARPSLEQVMHQV